MTLKTKFTALAAAVAIAATSFTPLAATPAQAGGAYSGGAEFHQVRDRRGRYYNRGGRHGYYGRHRGQRHYYKRKRDRTGKYIALGVGALMLGIIASEASRSHRRGYNYYDY